MTMLVKLVVGVSLAAAAGAGGAASHAHDKDQVIRVAAQRGQNLPASEIERRVKPTMPGWDYLGFIYDPATNIYTLKFLRNGSIVWVDVDGRTGRIVRRSGSGG